MPGEAVHVWHRWILRSASAEAKFGLEGACMPVSDGFGSGMLVMTLAVQVTAKELAVMLQCRVQHRK